MFYLDQTTKILGLVIIMAGIIASQKNFNLETADDLMSTTTTTTTVEVVSIRSLLVAVIMHIIIVVVPAGLA